MRPKSMIAIGMGLAFAMMTGSPGFAGIQTVPYWTGGSQQEYQLVLVVNKDQFEGKWKQFKGDLKKQWGKFTDDDLLQIEGSYDKFEGKMQERYGDKKEEVKRWTDAWFKKHGDKM